MKDNFTKFRIKVTNKYGEFITKQFPVSEFSTICDSLMKNMDTLKLPTSNGCMVLKKNVLNDSIFRFEFIE